MALVICLVGIFMLFEKNIKNRQRTRISMTLIFFFLLFFGLLFGSRNEDIGTDTPMYMWQYQNLFRFGAMEETREPLYRYLIISLRSISENPRFFLYFMAFIYVYTIFLFIKNYESSDKKNNINKFLFFISIISMPSFLSFGINIIRQGISIGFLLNALNSYNKKQYKWTLFFIFFSLNFHFTSLVPIILFSITKILAKVRINLLIYFAGIVLAYFKVGILALIGYLPFLSQYDPRFSAYITSDKNWDYNVGFKPQFVIFNTAFLIISLYIKNRIKRNNYEYDRLINYFCLSSFIFFMAFQIPYSDRWGIFSWCVIPLLLSPLVDMKISIKWYATFSYLFFVFIYLFFNIIYYAE